MAKYEVGDKVRIVNHRTSYMNMDGKMDKWLGKTMTIRKFSAIGSYSMEEDKHENHEHGWAWTDSMISGLSEPEKPEKPQFSVSVHFHNRLTVAELIKDGEVVKVENARCNPKDKYSMAEGARIAVERLFQKKVADKPVEACEVKIGDKFVVNGCSHEPRHSFPRGTVVKAVLLLGGRCVLFQANDGNVQYVNLLDLKPYKEKSK